MCATKQSSCPPESVKQLHIMTTVLLQQLLKPTVRLLISFLPFCHCLKLRILAQCSNRKSKRGSKVKDSNTNTIDNNSIIPASIDQNSKNLG